MYKASYKLSMWHSKYPYETNLAIILRHERFSHLLREPHEPFDIIMYTANHCFHDKFCKKYGVYSVPLNPHPDQQAELSYNTLNRDIQLYHNGNPVSVIDQETWYATFQEELAPLNAGRLYLRDKSRPEILIPKTIC